MPMQAESLEVLEKASVAPAQARAIVRSAGGVARPMYLAILGQMAVLLGFAYFFATHLQ